MGHIYREKGEVPVPEGAHINNYNAEVSVYEIDETGKRTGRRTVIGKAVSADMMYVNDNFRKMFSLKWREHFGEEPKPSEMHAGLYAAALGIGSQSGIYPLMVQIFGVTDANAVMDYVMYQICSRSSAVKTMEETMAEQIVFSSSLKSDSFYCRMFAERLAAQDKDGQFRLRWLAHCAQNGIEDVWLCIDGSNSDARITNSALAESGHAKSHKSCPVISCIWAVCAKTGLPVCWTVNPGGMHDSKAFERLISLIGEAGIKVKGIIIDRGFASEAVVQHIQKLGYEFVLMLPQSASGSKLMMKRYASQLFWNGEYWFFLNGRSMYGLTDTVKIFQHSENEYCVALFFDCYNGPCITNHHTDKIGRAIEKLELDLKKDLSCQIVPKELEHIARIERVGDTAKVVIADRSKLSNLARSSGFSAIASSQDLTAKEIAAIYDLRDKSEKQFADFKTGLGAGILRAHSDEAVKSRLMCSFIASVIHRSIINACLELGLDTNETIAKLDRIKFSLTGSNTYVCPKDVSTQLKGFLAKFGVTQSSLEVMCAEYNARQKAVHKEERELPQGELKPRGPGRPRKTKEEKPKKKMGRPKGSKNKSTLEREERQRAEGMAHAPKRKPGRPKGSKNKKTLEREALQRAQDAAPAPKRGPGRPKGSKNKKTLERLAQEAANLRKAQLRQKRREEQQKRKTEDQA